MRSLRPLLLSLLPLLLLMGCALSLDFDRFSGGEGEMDAGRSDGGDPPPVDGCVRAPETCNLVDDDCDGTIDEEPTECTVVHGSAVCGTEGCGLGACDEGFADCDDDHNICEVESATDHRNCGGCGTACGPIESCAAGSCSSIREQWAVYVSGSSAPAIRAEALAAVPDGVIGASQIFGTGNRIGTMTLPTVPSGEFHSVVYRISSAGSVSWQRTLDNPSVSVKAAAADSAGNSYVVGVASSADSVIYNSSVLRNGTNGTGFIVAIDPAGNFRWGHHYGQAGGARDVVVGPSDDLWVVGRYEGELRVDGDTFPEHLQSRGSFVVRQRANASIRWAVGFSEAEQPIDFVAVDDEGNVYVYGHSGTDFRVRSLDPDGVERWQAILDCPDGFTGSKGIAVSQGVVMIGGSGLGQVSVGDELVNAPFLAGLDAATGVPLWHREAGQTSNERVIGLPSGFLRVGLTGIDPVDFGFGVLPRPGGRDLFVERIEPDGRHRYGYLVGSEMSDQALSVAMSADESMLYVGGSETGTMSFGGADHTNLDGGGDAFIAQLLP